MCLSPVRLKDGSRVACRGCRLCADNRINDLIGRCIAEQVTSTAVFSVTLTYAGDVPEATVLRYRDVQLMLKSLRKDGYKVRYACAGEYGTRKGRAHWHIALFFKGKLPDVRQEARVVWKYWPHGFVYFQQPDYGGFRYVMKYALKDQASRAGANAFSLSKKPPLGYEFFMGLADDLVLRRLPIHSPEYSFAHVVNRKGRARRYWLRGRMRELFLDRYKAMWRMRYADDPPYTDFYLEQYEDKIERARSGMDVARVERDIDAKRPARVYIEPEPYAPEHSRRSIGYYFFAQGGDRYMIVAYPRGITADALLCRSDGEEWTIGLVNGVSVEHQLQRCGVRLSCAMLASRWLREKWGE